MSFQEITIIGFLGRDPEMQYTTAGQAMTNFSMATNRRFRDSQGVTVKETTWFQVTVWDRQAENANIFLKKGSQVMVKGRLNPDPVSGSPRIWERKDGQPAASYEVTAREIVYLGGFNGGEAQPTRTSSAESPQTGPIDTDIPF